MSTETNAATATKKIKVISERGGNKIIETTATNWKSLKADLIRAGYDLKDMKAVEGLNRHTLEHDDAVINYPETGLKLYLMPLKTKAGAKAASGDKPAKKAAPKKAAKKAATPKKAAKKAAPKKAATAKKASPKKAKAVAEVVEAVAEAKQPIEPDFGSDAENNRELYDLSRGFADVKR